MARKKDNLIKGVFKDLKNEVKAFGKEFKSEGKAWKQAVRDANSKRAKGKKK